MTLPLTGAGPSTGLRWLLRDEFTDTRAAGSVNGTPATPGGIGGAALNTRTAIDSGNKLSIAGGVAHFVNATTIGDPGLWYGAITRIPGRMAIFSVNWTTCQQSEIGLDSNQAGQPLDAVQCADVTGNIAARIDGYYPSTVGVVAASTIYYIAVVMRSTGALLFIRGGAYTYPTLLWVGFLGTGATRYPAIANRYAVMDIGFVGIPVPTWLPSPLVYDSFTRADGALGTSETSGPDGESVPARSWTTVSGTWAVSSSKAVASSAGIVILPSVGSGDYAIQAQVTIPAAGTTSGGLVVRYTDTDNYWYIKITPGTAGDDFFLIERNAGVETPRGSADVDWVAGNTYYINVVCSGTSEWRVFQYVLPSIVYTSVNTFNATATVIGLRDEGNSNFKFDNVIVYPRGTGGEFSYLESVFYPSNGNIFLVGDSRTFTGGNTWDDTLIANLNTADPSAWWVQYPLAYGINGYDVEDMKLYVDANLSSLSDIPPRFILINLGANDFAAMPAEATWKANYTSIIDSFRAKWATSTIYLARPWSRGQGANSNIMAGWIDDIIAGYASRVALGHDERVWMEGGDDGTTMTTDGIHYSAAGQIECAAQWQTVLGF